MSKASLVVMLAIAVAVIGCGSGQRPSQSVGSPAPAGAVTTDAGSTSTGDTSVRPTRVQDGLVILVPRDWDTVPEAPLVSGTISDTGVLKIWLVVHPLKDGDSYWVQSPANVSDSRWQAQTHIGHPTLTKAGELFEVGAFAKPTSTLETGQVLADWPKAAIRSRLVTWVAKR